MSILNRSYSSSIACRAAKLLALLLLLTSCASAQVLTRTYSSGGAGRSFGTVFQNTSAIYPLLVIVHESPDSGGGNFQGIIGATNLTVTDIRYFETPSFAGGGPAHDVTFFFVPPLYFYKVNGNTLIWWEEYQVLTGTLTDSGDLGPSGANTRTLGGGPYTNAGPNGIVVLAQINGLSVSGDNNTGVSNLATTYKVDLDAAGIGGNGSFATQTVRLFVPAGSTYQVSTVGGILLNWHEYGIGATFTDPGDETTKLGLNNVVKNTGSVPWFVSITGTFASTGSSGGIGILTDASNPPTTNQASEWKREAGFGQFLTVTGVVMPGEYIQNVAQSVSGGTVALTGARIYSLNGIPFAPTPVRQFSNP